MKQEDNLKLSNDDNQLSSDFRKKQTSELINNSSLIKSIQMRNSRDGSKASRGREKEETNFPEIPGVAKDHLQMLNKPLAKKLPSQRNVTSLLEVPGEPYPNKQGNLARHTEQLKYDNIIINQNKSKTKRQGQFAGEKEVEDLSMDSNDSYEELKEDFSGSEAGFKHKTSKGGVLQQPRAQAKRNIKIFDDVTNGEIKESRREDLDSEAVSPEEHKFEGETPQAPETDEPQQKMPRFKLNIVQTRQGNSSNRSEISNKSKVDSQKSKPDNTQLQQTQMEVDIQRLMKEEILKSVGGPEPLYELSHKYAEGSDSPMWKKKQMRNRTVIKEDVEKFEEVSEDSVSLSDGEEGSDLPGDQGSEKSQTNYRGEFDDGKKKKKTKKNKAIQEKLERHGEKILIQTEKAINIEAHKDTFGYQIYDGYRPQNLAQTRDYLEFLTKSNENLKGDILSEDWTPKHILEYMDRDLATVLPEDINQKHILRFDQNFEGGNLDSAYIHNPNEYNLLLKVDSNTKGNTYWFYYGIQNFKVGQRYTFNIYNFTRSMEKFYKDGMNVLTKAEKLHAVDVEAVIAEKMGGSSSKQKEERGDGNTNLDKTEEIKIEGDSPEKEKEQEQQKKETTNNYFGQKDERFSDWRYGTCENVYFETSDILRTKNFTNMQKYQMTVKDKEKYYYQKLSFSYRFKPEDANKQVLFAYALPYTYSNLLQDLEEAKKILRKSESPMPYQSPQKNTEDGKEAEDLIENSSLNKPNFRYIDKTDLLDHSKFRNLSTYHQDEQFPTGQMLTNESPVDLQHNKNLNSNNTDDTVSPKKQNKGSQKMSTRMLNNLNSGTKQNLKNSQFDFIHNQIKKQGTEQMNFKTSKFETEFIKEEAGGKKHLKQLFDEAAEKEMPTVQEQNNFEITNDYLQYRQEVISQSMGGLNIYQITLTKRRSAGAIPHKKKQVIYIQARVHAAETHGSFIMSSIIKEFSHNYRKYDQILNSHIIKLVPMLNPDGVVLGNSRSSLAGVDLNRRWSNPNATMHPELYFLKMSMRETKKASEGIAIFCDLHGHNKNSNCFIYGCNKAPNEGLLSWTKTRLLPKIIASYEPIFDFNMCKFSQEKTKYNTARVVVWNEFKVTNSFTLETSQFGMKVDKSQKSVIKRRGNCKQLLKNNFDEIGVNLLISFKQFSIIEAKLSKELKKNGGWFKKKQLDEVTGQSARSKLDQQMQNYSYRKNFAESSKLIANNLPKKASKPLRHNTSDQLTLTNRLGKQKMQSSNNVLSTGAQPKSTTNQNAKQSMIGKKFSIRIESDGDSLASKSDGGDEQQPKEEKCNTQQSPLKAKEQLKLQIIKAPKKESSMRHIKVDNPSPIKGGEFSNKSKDAQKMTQISSNKKQIVKDSYVVAKQGTNKSINPKKKESNKSVAAQGIDMPDFLAEYFSKNEYVSAVQESQKPIVSKKAEKHASQGRVATQDDAESDSEPSDDNFDQQEQKKIFSEALSEEDIQEIFSESVAPVSERINTEPNNMGNYAGNNGDLNIVIEQVSEQDEHQESQSFDRPPNIEQPVQQQDLDTERLRDKINSLQEYQQIAQQLKSAQMESKQLADKFEKLSKKLNQKIKGETLKNKQIAQVSPQLQVQQQYYRGGWNEISQPQILYQNIHHVRNSSMQPIPDNQEIVQNSNSNRMRGNHLLPAGPMSGESKSGERQRTRGLSSNNPMNNYNQEAINAQNALNFPAIGNVVNQNAARAGNMATSQAKANKYKSRNSILNMSTYNMENGLAMTTKQPQSILGNLRQQQMSVHVHPEYSRSNQVKSQTSQGLGGMIIGTQMKQSQNLSPKLKEGNRGISSFNTSSKKKATIGNINKRAPDGSLISQQSEFKIEVAQMQQPVTAFEQNMQNFNAALRNDHANRGNGMMPLNETIKTNTSFFSNPTPQGQSKKRAQMRRQVADGKKSSMPISDRVIQESNNNHQSIYQSDNQSYAQSSNDTGVIPIQMQSQMNKNRDDVKTSPVLKGEFHLNSSLEWVHGSGPQQKGSPYRNKAQRNPTSESHQLRTEDLQQLNRQRKTSPKNHLSNFHVGTSQSANKIRQDLFNDRTGIETNQNIFYKVQVENSVGNHLNQYNNDYQESDYNQLSSMNNNIHGALHSVPQTQPKISQKAKDFNPDIDGVFQDSQYKSRHSVNIQGDRSDSVQKSQQTSKNFFQSDNVKQYLQNQQIILKPHQIRRGVVNQNQAQMNSDLQNNESINKKRRLNKTKIANTEIINQQIIVDQINRKKSQHQSMLNTGKQMQPSIKIASMVAVAQEAFRKDPSKQNQDGVKSAGVNVNRKIGQNLGLSPSNLIKNQHIATEITPEQLKSPLINGDEHDDGFSTEQRPSFHFKKKSQVLGHTDPDNYRQKLPKTVILSPCDFQGPGRNNGLDQNNQQQMTAKSNDLLNINDFPNFRGNNIIESTPAASRQDYPSSGLTSNQKGVTSTQSNRIQNQNHGGMIIKQGKSRRYGSKQIATPQSPQGPVRGFGPTPVDTQFGIQSVAYMQNDNQMKGGIIISARSPISKTPGKQQKLQQIPRTQKQSTTKRNSELNGQYSNIEKESPHWNNNQLQQLNEGKRVNTQNDRNDNHLLNPDINGQFVQYEASSSGQIQDIHNKVIKFEFKNNNSVMQDRNNQHQFNTAQKGVTSPKNTNKQQIIQEQRQQVQNILKSMQKGTKDN